MNRNKRTTGGFTLIELVVTMAIAAILLTQGVPSFITMTKNNRMITQTNDLVGDINLARSESVKRGVRVVLCRSADPSAASPTCGGTANTWTTGWLMFATIDGDTTFDASNANYTLIRIGQPASTTLNIIANSNSNNNLEYNPDGTLNEAGAAIFAICDDRGASDGRQIQVNVMGRPQLVKGSDSTINCTSPAQV